MNSKQLAKKWPYPRHSEFEKELREAAKKWFSKKGFAVHSKMPYCLDKWVNWKRNIILPEVSIYIENFKTKSESKNKPFPLHKYIHHGLSSQAMVFNLIGALITRNDLSPLIDLLKSKGINDLELFNHAEFEYEDRNVFNEDSGQPTSIDLVLFDKNINPKIFIESKLVEAEFGGCSVFKKGDCAGQNPLNNKSECYLHFIGRKYWALIEKFGFDEKLKNEKICVFVNYYQFFREILFSLEKNGIFTLLYDERSPVFNYSANGKVKGLIPLLLDFVPEEHKNKIILISVQEVLNSISKYEKHNDWIDEFKNKYGMK